MSRPPRAVIPRLSDVPLAVEGRAVRLRPQVPGDADAFFPLVSDPEVARFVTWSPHTDIAETRAWIAQAIDKVAAGTSMIWTIEHAGQPVGCISLLGITWQVRAVRWDRCDLGYWLGRPYWGKGLMTEAAILATGFAFDTLGLHKMGVRCIDENVGSRRVIEKVGFKLLCREPDDAWKDGRWWSHLRYELDAETWDELTRRRPAS